MIILPFLPILALIIQTSFSLNELIKSQIDSSDTETQVSQIFCFIFTVCDGENDRGGGRASTESDYFVCHFHNLSQSSAEKKTNHKIYRMETLVFHSRMKRRSIHGTAMKKAICT